MRRRGAGSANARRGDVNLKQLAEVNVMDEAFASFDDFGARLGAPAIDMSLAATLAAQVEALDRQREHLANLLRCIEVRGEASMSAAL
jgi:hypothetical protein